MVSNVKAIYTKRNGLYHFIFFTILGYDRCVKAFLHSSILLHADMRILDVGCGSGLCTKTLLKLAEVQDLDNLTFNAFDLTEAMLASFQQWTMVKQASNVAITQADLMALERLPEDWRDYSLIIAAASLEYLPKDKLSEVLKTLRTLLAKDGELIVIITRQNAVTRVLVNWLWKANIYKKKELETKLQQAAFKHVQFLSFPGKMQVMNLGMFIVKL